MNYYTIGQRIRKFRKINTLSQEALAEKIGISYKVKRPEIHGRISSSQLLFIFHVQTSDGISSPPGYHKSCRTWKAHSACGL